MLAQARGAAARAEPGEPMPQLGQNFALGECSARQRRQVMRKIAGSEPVREELRDAGGIHRLDEVESKPAVRARSRSSGNP